MAATPHKKPRAGQLAMMTSAATITAILTIMATRIFTMTTRIRRALAKTPALTAGTGSRTHCTRRTITAPTILR